MSFRKQIKLMNKKIQEHNEKMKPIKEMELFVLDNSLRESTVAQLRGHTIENKWKIYEEVSHVLFLIWTPKWKLRGGLVKSISAGQSMIHVLPSFVLILLSPFFALYYLLFHSLFLVSSLPPFLHDILMYRQTIGKFWLFLPDSLFSPKAPLTKGPLLPWNLNICQIHVKFKRPICHFR